MKHRCTMVLLLLACVLQAMGVAQDVAPNVLLLDDMKTIEKWGGGKTEHSPDRGGALKWQLDPGGKVQATSISLAPFKVDPKQYDWLKFEYKIDGPVHWFGVKIQHYLLHDSQQVVYRAYGPGEGTADWCEASLDIEKPEAVWEYKGDKKLEVLFLRAQSAKESGCTIYIQNLRLVRLPVKVSFREVVGKPSETRYAIDMKNVDARPHEVALTTDASALRAFAVSLSTERVTIEPGMTAAVTADLALKPDQKKPPLYSETASVSLRVQGEPDCSAPLALLATVPLPALDRPFVFTTREQIANAKEKIEKYPWAKKIYDDMLKKADKLLDAPTDIPDRTGSWSHYYACQDCGSRLKTVTPTEHKCTGCEKAYSGDPYDAVVVTNVHHRWADNARDLGLAYAFTNDAKYARRSAEIFKEYEKRYRTYEPHNLNKKGNGWKVIDYSLGQSVWVIPIAQGYDFIRDAGVLTDEEKQRIENDFFRDIAKSVQGHRGIHNITCWRNAAVGTIGLAIGDPDLVRWAIEDPAGLKQEIAEGILEDGFWFEGSWGYHFYALSPLCHLAESADHVGINVFNDRFETMFTAPLQFMTVDRWLPAFNDSGAGSRVGYSWCYGLAAQRYPKSKEIAWLVSDALERGQVRDIASLLYTPGEVAKVDAPPMKTHLFQGSGIVVLRSPSPTDQIYVAFEYGPHGGGHGHPDKLGFVMCALGRQLAVDPGSISYAVPLHKRWYRQTIAHNTLTVDRESQQPTTGELLYMGSSPEFQVACARTTEACPGVEFTRTIVIIGDDCALVADLVKSDAEHLYDIAFHIVGELKTDLNVQPPAAPVGETNGYDVLEDVKVARGAPMVRAEFAIKDKEDKEAKGPMGIHMLCAGAEDAEIITGLGRGNPPTERVPCVILRRQAKAASYVTLLEPFRGQARVKSIARHPVLRADGTPDPDAFGIAVESANWRFIGIVAPSQAQRACPALKLETDGKAALVLLREGQVAAVLVMEGNGVAVDGKRIVATQR
ncbi:MAG: heparinase II/III family protein [Planctomycetota bacterium]